MPSHNPTMEPGAKLDRFIVIDVLGQGAMGLVVSAYDPNLDRKVAIKVVRWDRNQGEAASTGQQRLLREAQALARLSHPNVVTIFEVGALGEQVFLAMEYVEGPTLREWQSRKSRSWRELVDVYLQAGEGLAAAHAAGIVHRDFKPDNVLIHKSGRACVSDFGLADAAASPTDGVADTPERLSPADQGRRTIAGDRAVALACTVVADSHRLDDAPAASSGGLLGHELTRTGQVLGTPAYMPPEQFRAGKVDARSDQFAFCVALYEALYGQLPFAGETVAEMWASAANGDPRLPSPRSSVPIWIGDALLRGLSREPGARFPSMADLLKALTIDPLAARRRRARIAGAIGAAAALAATVGFAVHQWTRVDRCRPVARELLGVWDEPVQGALRHSFLATGRPYAGDVYMRVATLLDDYSSGLVAMRSAACEATYGQHTQSERILDLRNQCLDHRRSELGALTAVLSQGLDGDRLNSAVPAALAITPVATCADVASLAAAVPPPENPRLRARVEELSQKLDRLEAEDLVGKVEDVLKESEAVDRQAATLDYVPLQARSRMFLARQLEYVDELKRSETSFREALLLAALAKDDSLAAKGWIELIDATFAAGRTSEALSLMPAAEVALNRAPNSVALRGRFLEKRAWVLTEMGRTEEALRDARESLAIADSLGAHRDKTIAFEASIPLNALGVILHDQGRYSEATSYLERALASSTTTQGVSSIAVAFELNNLCLNLKDARMFDRARPYCERAAALEEALSGPTNRNVALPLAHLGEVLCAQGHGAEGLATEERALAIWSKTLPAGHIWRPYAQTALGICLIELRRDGDAIAPLEQALSVREHKPGHSDELAKSRFALARAMWDSDQHQSRALSLARQALEDYVNAGAAHAVERDQVSRWLSQHRMEKAQRRRLRAQLTAHPRDQAARTR